MSTRRPRALRERGASAVEYAILISGVAAVIAAIVYFFGTNVASLFNDTCDEVQQQSNATSC